MPPAFGKFRHPARRNHAQLLRFDAANDLARLEGDPVLRGIIGAILGEKLASRSGNRATGALLGVGIAALAKRGLGPLGVALAAGYGVKKLVEYRRAKRSPVYPPEASVSPAPPLEPGASA